MSSSENDLALPEREIDSELQRERRADDDAMNRKSGLPLTIWKDCTCEEKQAIYEENQRKIKAFYVRQKAAGDPLEALQNSPRRIGGY
jgi:hypothetical protein